MKLSFWNWTNPHHVLLISHVTTQFCCWASSAFVLFFLRVSWSDQECRELQWNCFWFQIFISSRDLWPNRERTLYVHLMGLTSDLWSFSHDCLYLMLICLWEIVCDLFIFLRWGKGLFICVISNIIFDQVQKWFSELAIDWLLVLDTDSSLVRSFGTF